MAEEENKRFIECGDDRFEIIKRAREHIIDATNIESRPEEMQVLDNFLFRCWQMGWLKNDFHQLEKENEELKKGIKQFQKDNEVLYKTVNEKNEQIEKMKNCANCKHCDCKTKKEIKICGKCTLDKLLWSQWELAE